MSLVALVALVASILFGRLDYALSIAYYRDNMNEQNTGGVMEHKSWVYYGKMIPIETYREMKAKEEKGQCPFCGRQGLSGRYGSKKKHIRSCVRK